MQRLRLEVTEDAYRLMIEPLHPGDHWCVVEVMRALDDTPSASIAALLGHELQGAAREINAVVVE